MHQKLFISRTTHSLGPRLSSLSLSKRYVHIDENPLEKFALVFPGQGAQHVGMAKDIYDQFECAREVVDECEEAVGGGLKELMFHGSQELLTLTPNAQPAILTHSIALLRVLEEHYGLDVKKCTYALGHSLGEYSALVATGALSLVEAVQLVRLRGQAMQYAVTEKETAMRALMVRNQISADVLLAEIQKAVPSGEVAEIANINTGDQIVLSGTKTGVEEVASALHSLGLTSRSLPLPVSAPFHCSLMQPAADILKPALESIKFQKPVVDVVSNVTARPFDDPEEIGSLLYQQVTQTVQWRKSVQYARDDQVFDWLVIGPSRVLSNLLKKDLPHDNVQRVATVSDLRHFREVSKVNN